MSEHTHPARILPYHPHQLQKKASQLFNFCKTVTFSCKKWRMCYTYFMNEEKKSSRKSKKAVYKCGELEDNYWFDDWTIDNVRVGFNEKYQWAFTCQNRLCGSKYYKKAVNRYNDFIAKLVGWFGSAADPVWWFRGQSNITWPVLPSALRPDITQSVYSYLPVISFGNEYTWRQLYFEKKIMSDFVRNGSGLKSCDASSAEWYIIAQHHGMPTRLLDWSLNPFVALWMAVCDVNQADQDGVLIAMLPTPRDKKLCVCNKWNEDRKKNLIDWLTKPISEQAVGHDLKSKAISEIEEYCKDEAILTYTPFNYSARQSQQQSVFTLHTPPPLDSKCMSNVGVNEFYETRELVIPAEYKEFYKTFLFASGVRRWNIFPDLDNLARGVKEAMVVVPGSKVRMPLFKNQPPPEWFVKKCEQDGCPLQ